MSRNANLPLRKTMCATCPFRAGSPTAYLAADLAASAISEASRICHSTGSNNAFHRQTGLPEHICRGARDVQLRFMAAAGVIDAPTDDAWNEARTRIGMAETVVRDPVIRRRGKEKGKVARG